MRNEPSDHWYKGKIILLIREMLFTLFSFSFVKAVSASFSYYLHEHVHWRLKIQSSTGNYRIHARTSIRNAQNIMLGDNVRITMNCCIWAESNSKIIIGNNVLIGPGVKVFSANHGTELSEVNIVNQKRVEADIVIGNNVWIGANSVITSGVRIDDGAVVGAGSVVTKNVMSNTVVGGVPARFIKNR